MRPKIFIDGEHGTTGLQIRTRLAARDDIEIIVDSGGRAPQGRGARAEFLNAADIAILCLPDDAAREAWRCSTATIRPASSTPRPRIASPPDWAYGFAEMDDEQSGRIAKARKVANPGCYPTGAIGLVRPLVEAGLLPADYPITVNGVSGYTGGGKQLIAQMEDAGRADHIAAPHFLYGLSLQHKHVPEIERHGLLARRPIFSPASAVSRRA